MQTAFFCSSSASTIASLFDVAIASLSAIWLSVACSSVTSAVGASSPSPPSPSTSGTAMKISSTLCANAVRSSALATFAASSASASAAASRQPRPSPPSPTPRQQPSPPLRPGIAFFMISSTISPGNRRVGTLCDNGVLEPRHKIRLDLPLHRVEEKARIVKTIEHVPIRPDI